MQGEDIEESKISQSWRLEVYKGKKKFSLEIFNYLQRESYLLFVTSTVSMLNNFM